MVRQMMWQIGWMSLCWLGVFPDGQRPPPSATVQKFRSPEIGSRKSEVGSRKSEVGSPIDPSSVFRRPFSVVRFPSSVFRRPFSVVWTPPERLTANEREDTSPAALRSRKGTVWLFYQGGQPQDFNTTEIYYRTFAEGKWTPEIRLTDNQASDSSPSVFEAQDGKLWLFWRTGRGSNYNSYEICYRTFDGRAWSPPQSLTRNEVGDFRPCALQTREGTIWAFWSRGRGYDFSSYEVYHRTFAGGQWSEERRLTRNEVMDFNPAAAQTQKGDLWLVWSSQAEGQSHLRAQRYHRGKWQPPRTLTADLPGGHFNPTIMEDEKGRLWLAWDCSRDRLRSFEVYVRTSSDGVRWSPAEPLTRSLWNRDATLLAGPKGEVWAFWSGGKRKQAEIFWSRRGEKR